MKRSAYEVLITEEQINKKRNLSPSRKTLSSLDALPLHTIFTFIGHDDLFTQLALYGTCVSVMTFVRSEKTLPLNGILQLKKFIDENPNISKISLHYRMCGLLHQFAWLNQNAPIEDYSKITKELPNTLLEYCQNGLIEARYAYCDEFYGGGFTYIEAAVKKVNSNDKIRLKYTELDTIHGRGFEDVGFLVVSINDTSVYNGKGITDLEELEALTRNAEICKNMKGIELLNSLFNISIDEKDPHQNGYYDTRFTDMKFDIEHESLIDSFITELVDLNNQNISPLITTLISITENLCKVQLIDGKKEGAISDNDASEFKIKEENEDKSDFDFISLVKNNINYVNYDEYSSYGRQHIVCKLKRKDNNELVDVSVTAIMGPSYTGTHTELEIEINGEAALTFKLEEGSVNDDIVQDNYEEFVQSFKNGKNAHSFTIALLEFIISKPPWGVYSYYGMESDKTGITLEGGPTENISEVLDYFCEHTDCDIESNENLVRNDESDLEEDSE